MDFGGVRFPSREWPEIRAQCCVEECTSNSQDDLTLKFHPFPRKSYNFEVVNPVTFIKKTVWTYKVWKRALRINQVDSNTFVCSLHFRRDDYIDIDDEIMCRLKHNAVPSCNMFIPVTKVWYTAEEEKPPSDCDESTETESEDEIIPKGKMSGEESGNSYNSKILYPISSDILEYEETESEVDEIPINEIPIVKVNSSKTNKASRSATPCMNDIQELTDQIRLSTSSALPETTDSPRSTSPDTNEIEKIHSNVKVVSERKLLDKSNILRSGGQRSSKNTKDFADTKRTPKRTPKRKFRKILYPPNSLKLAQPQFNGISNITSEKDDGKPLPSDDSGISKTSVETQTNQTINPRTFPINKSSQTKLKYFSDANSITTQTSQTLTSMNPKITDRSEASNGDDPELLIIDVNKITESEPDFQVVNTISDSNSQRIKIFSKIKLLLEEPTPINVSCDGIVDVNSVSVDIITKNADEDQLEEVSMEIDITGEDIENVIIEIGGRTWSLYLE
ncbi:hypothetical protein TKK_0001110 [Trichogramma kaykai]|uniref:THAP-type domain-containing protein n=1 Tax=Trichogramma kaykai TaxID=54128 RepID=A0ABD2WSF1_9HYME